jgi:predicted amino acid-binding ACT domain protein
MVLVVDIDKKEHHEAQHLQDRLQDEHREIFLNVVVNIRNLFNGLFHDLKDACPWTEPRKLQICSLAA